MLQSLVHVCLAGLSTGMFIWLVASGLTLIFGVLGVLNFAHGSFYMLGAYFCYTLLGFMGSNFWLGLLLGLHAATRTSAVATRGSRPRRYRRSRQANSRGTPRSGCRIQGTRPQASLQQERI